MKWISDHRKLLGIIAFIVAAIAGRLIARHFIQKPTKAETKVLVAASKIGFATTGAKQVIDSTGHRHYQVAAPIPFTASTIAANPQVNLGGADTVAKAMNIQRDQIQFWMAVATKSEARALKAESKRDSMGRLVRYYESKFIKLAYHPGKDSTDNGTFDYTKYESLRVLQHWKRLHLIGPRSSFLDISSLDTNTRITGVSSFSVLADPNPFTLRAQAKTAFDFATGRLIPSVGLIVGYKNFEFSGRYYYSPRFERLEPIISGAYNLWLR